MGYDEPSNIDFVPLGFRQLDGWKVFLRSSGLGNTCFIGESVGARNWHIKICLLS